MDVQVGDLGGALPSCAVTGAGRSGVTVLRQRMLQNLSTIHSVAWAAICVLALVLFPLTVVVAFFYGRRSSCNDKAGGFCSHAMQIAFLGIFAPQRSKKMFADYFPYSGSAVVPMDDETRAMWNRHIATEYFAQTFSIPADEAAQFVDEHGAFSTSAANCNRDCMGFFQKLSSFLGTGKVGNSDSGSLLLQYDAERKALDGPVGAACGKNAWLKNREMREECGKFLVREIGKSSAAVPSPMAAELESVIVAACQTFGANNREIYDALWSMEGFRPILEECHSFIVESLRAAGISPTKILLVMPDVRQLMKKSMNGDFDFLTVAGATLREALRLNAQNQQLRQVFSRLRESDIHRSVIILGKRLRKKASENPMVVCRLCLAEIIRGDRAC